MSFMTNPTQKVLNPSLSIQVADMHCGSHIGCFQVTSPFLIRVFVTKGKHTPLGEFDDGNFPLRDEFQLYAWKTSTPTSLIRLLLPSFPAPYRSPLARYAFRHIYVDASSRGLYRSKDLVAFSGRDIFPPPDSSSSALASGADVDGMDIDGGGRGGAGERNSKRRPVDEKTLDEYDFVTGDLLSVSLHIPEPKIPAGAAASTSALAQGPGGPRPGMGNVGPGGPGSRDRQASGSGAQSFGWNDRTARDGPGHGHGHGRGQNQNRDEVKGHWGRGEPLPPQDIAGASGRRGGGRFGARAGGGSGDHEIAGGGNWRGGAAGGFGIRGRGGRRSPEYSDADGTGRRDSHGNGGGYDNESRRSRSPDLRSREKRESWSSRR
ncbi:hypothetical protein I317_00341 [Kwoniella heveanensis CBS 569]|nr:hypothetical protein I317_00341 [Kwoniella heveanensis CBS 569]